MTRRDDLRPRSRWAYAMMLGGAASLVALLVQCSSASNEEPTGTTSEPLKDTCTITSYSLTPASPQVPGAQVLVQASATCASTDGGIPQTPEYQFYVQAPGGTNQIKQPYSTTGSWTWDTTGDVGGIYHVEVSVSAVGDGQNEASKQVPYTLGSGNTCSTVSLTPNPLSPQAPGTSVLFTANAMCSAGATMYQFYVQPPGGSNAVVQSFSTTNTFTWNSPNTTGDYLIEVVAEPQGNPGGLVTRQIHYDLDVPLSGYGNAAATAFCNRVSTCCGNTGFNLSQCITDNEVYGWESSLPPSMAEYGSPNLVYNPTAGSACISALGNMPCGAAVSAAQYAAVTSACFGPLHGNIAVGSGPCTSSFECVPGSYCVKETVDAGAPDAGGDAGKGGVESLCEPLVAVGAACSQVAGDDACSYLGEETAVYCNRINGNAGATCANRLANGLTCGSTSEFDDEACTSLLCGDNDQCGSTVALPTKAYCSYYGASGGN